MRVVQQGVPHRAGTRRAGVPSADDHQVRPGGQPDQRAGRVTVHDLLPDRHVGVLGPPLVEQAGRAAGPRPPRPAAPGFGGRLAGPGDLGLRHVPGVHGQQARCRRLASSNAKVSASPQLSRSATPTPTSPCGLGGSSRMTTTGQDAWLAAYRLTEPSSRAVNAPMPREPSTSISAPAPHSVTACAAGPVSWSVSISTPACRLGGPLGRRGQRLVTLAEQDVGHPLVLARARARPHPGRRLRGGHDPQRGAAERGLPGGPADRPQGFLRTIRTGHDGLGCHCSSSLADLDPGVSFAHRHHDRGPSPAARAFGP